MSKMVPAQQKVANVRSFLEKARPQIALALPKHMTPDRMLRVALTSILQNPKLLDCDQASLGGALVTCAQLGLEPDPLLGQAYLVPFRNRKRGIYEVVVIAGYRGLMKLARNTGEIATFDAHAVHARDKFEYQYGLSPYLRHTPYPGPEDPGPETHYYAVAVMKGGTGQFVVMTKAEVEQHRARFSRAVEDDGPWRTDFGAMALKTCIRRLMKFLPTSVELQRATTLDEHVEAGIPQDLGALLELPEAPGASTNGGALDNLAERLEQERANPRTELNPEREAASAMLAEREAIIAECASLFSQMPEATGEPILRRADLGDWKTASLDSLIALRDELRAEKAKVQK